MNFKIKIGVGLVVTLAMSAMSIMSASAVTGGHFTSTVAHTKLSGESIGANLVRYHFFGNSVECTHTTLSGTVSGTTVTETTILVDPTNCHATFGEATITMEGCDFILTVRSSPATNDNTLHLFCPGQVGPIVTISSFLGHCELEITANQTPSGGVAYETGGSGSTHDLTLNFTVSGLHVVRRTGSNSACGFTSETTTTTGQITGEATLIGRNTSGTQVGIAAT